MPAFKLLCGADSNSDAQLWEMFQSQNETPEETSARHNSEEESDRRAQAATARRHNRTIDIATRVTMKRQREGQDELGRASKRRLVTEAIGVGRNEQDFKYSVAVLAAS